MSIPEIKTDLVNSIKGIDIEISAIRRRFESKLPYIKPEEELHEKVIDYVYDNNDRLSKILNNVPELKVIDVNDIKIECWVWSNICKQYCTIDLDEYYGGGYEPYLYKLIVGGENHGDIVMNGYHEDNTNNFDIVYKVGGLHNDEFDTYTSDIRLMVEQYFRYYDPIKEENEIKKDNFNKYIRNHRIELITEVYRKIASNYSLILSYNKKGNQLYDVMIRQSEILLDQATQELNKTNVDPEYSKLCTELYKLITSVISDMSEWYENVDKCIYRIANDKVVSDVRHHILSFV